MATGITAEAINQMIQEALATQAEAHNKELAAKLAEQAARFRTSSASSAAHTTTLPQLLLRQFHPLARRFQGLD